MAKIENVDYEAMPGQASEIRGQGKTLNGEMKTAYASVENMHSVWYGKRYNDLLSEFNKIIPTVNEMLELVVTRIPSTLETIANNYAQADTGSTIVTVNNDLPEKIAELVIPTDVGMRFLQEEVETVKTNVVTNFGNAKSAMEQIQAIYNRISWKSEASEAFASQFGNLKTKIVSSLDSIMTSFTELMGQTASDIQTTENSNTVQ